MCKYFVLCIIAILLLSVCPATGGESEESPLDVLNQLGWRHTALNDSSPAGEVNQVAMPVSASKPEEVQLSLLDAIRFSLEGNQDIQVVSYTPRQSAEDVADAESVFDPFVFADSSFRREPNLQSSVTDIVMEDTGLFQTGIRKPLGTGGSLSTFLEMRYGDLINAEFDRTYKYIFAPTFEIRQPLLKNLGSREEKAAIKIANHQANISDEEFRREIIETATRVSRVYWQLFLFMELVRIDQQNLDMAEEVHRRESVRLSEGISQKLDVERARSNAEARRGTLLRSRERYRAAMDQLKLLLNRSNLTIDSQAEVIPVEEPQMLPADFDENTIIKTALQYRPELKKAIQELRIRQVEEDLTAHQRLPNLDVFGRYSLSGYGQEFSSAVSDTGIDDNDAWAVGLNFEWPIGNNSAKSQYRKRLLGRQQAVAQVKRIGNQIKLDVKQVLLALFYAKGEIESTRLAKQSAEQVVSGEFARFDIGQKTNEELLRAQDLLAATSRNFIRAVIDYNISMADLARVQGILPEGVIIDDIRP